MVLKREICSYLVPLMLFTTAASFAIGFGYYKSAVANEGAAFNIGIEAGVVRQAKPVMLDIANQGLPKRLLQPGQVLISTYALRNEGKEPLPLYIEAMGFDGGVTLESGPAGFEKIAGQISRTVEPQKSIPLKVRVSISAVDPDKHCQTAGIIRITDSRNGSVVGEVPVLVINSAAAVPGNLPSSDLTPQPVTRHDNHASH